MLSTGCAYYEDAAAIDGIHVLELSLDWTIDMSVQLLRL